jgi:hypothetical protein
VVFRNAELVDTLGRRYRLHLEDGSDAGEATYAQMVHAGDEIHVGAGQRFRVLDVVPFEEEDESPFVGLLQVEAAKSRSGPSVLLVVCVFSSL